ENPGGLGGSTYEQLFGVQKSRTTSLNPALGASIARYVASKIADGKVRAAHDVSDGGLLCSVAEMLIAGSSADQPIGAEIVLDDEQDAAIFAFNEAPCGYVLEVENTNDFHEWMKDLP